MRRWSWSPWGGVGWRPDALQADLGRDDPWLVIPGSPERTREGRVIRLPARSEFYHPDLIHAADVVVGKLGYSTLAEVSEAGVPFGYVARPQFPESSALETWLQRERPCRGLTRDQLTNGDWLTQVRALLRVERRPPTTPSGATAVARLLIAIIGTTRARAMLPI